MAKKTKDSNLSIEERLEQALIPNWDEPYKLPENWCWVKLDNVTSVTSGGTPSRGNPLYWENGNIPWAKISDISGKYLETTEEKITQLGLENSSAKIFEKGTLLYSIFATIGDVAILNIDAATNQAIAGITCSKLCNVEYMYYVLLVLKDLLVTKAKGVAQVNINQSILKETPIPLAPLKEQARIVEYVNSLFKKLDEAKEKAQEVVDGFETRKAAILHKAFSGELTQKWREENNHSLNEWSSWSISELCHSLKYGTAKKSKSEGPVVVIRMGNLQQGEIDWNDLAYSDDAEDIEKYKLYPGDVLFNRTNSAALVGKTSIYRGEYPAIFAGYLIKLDYDHSIIIGDYLNYALNTTNAKAYCNSVKTDGVNQSNINAKKIGAFSIPVAPIDEQEEIVGIIKNLLNKEKSAKDLAETVIDQIGTMKKAILARAFRGELGTNDPSEESAVQLIKQIIEERIKAEDTKQKRTPKKRKEVLIVAKTILETLKSAEKLTPEKLKVETGLKIDDFYDQLKVLIDSGQVREIRIDGESYLEAVL